MTSTVLPFQNKLSSNYSKTVAFKNFVCVSHNQYIRKMGNGLACRQVTYSLKYIGLTQAELTEVETLFSTHDIDSYISWKAPIDFKSFNYRKPLSWQKENYSVLTSGTPIVKERLFDVSFEISTSLSPSVIADFETHFGALQANDDSALIAANHTTGYLQAFDNDVLPYVASGSNYDVQLYDGQTFSKTITVAGEGTWSIDNFGAVTFEGLPSFTSSPTPLQYVIWDRWYRRSNFASLTFTPAEPPGTIVKATNVFTPQYMCFDGTSIWIASSSDSVYKLNPSDMSFVRYLTGTNSRPSGICFDGTYIWVSCVNVTTNPDTILKINPANGSIVANYIVGNTNQYIIYTTNYLYVGSIGSIKSLSTAGVVQKTYNLSPSVSIPLYLHSTGGFLWVTTTSGILRKFNLDLDLIASYDLSSYGTGNLHGITGNNTYKWVVFSNGTLLKLRAVDGVVLTSTSLGTNAEDALLLANGSVAVSSVGTPTSYVTKIVDSSNNSISLNPTSTQRGLLEHNGYLYVANEGSNSISRIKL